VAHCLDVFLIAILPPLAFYLTLSGLDDLFIDLAWLVTTCLKKAVVKAPTEEELAAPERRIAIFVPLWHEHQVIAAMLTHNIGAIRYRKYDFFIGAYPNDERTLDAVREMEARFSNVHLAVCPHDGPTSKADCLNWIYRHLLLHEERTRQHFGLVLTHDAEDMIHPESLRWMNHFANRHHFIQIPVLALHTSPFDWTHGVYCDEFAEFQTRDLAVRNRLGGFIPSAGVGTGYLRPALEALAARSAHIFEPECLTEDYENGRRLHELGFSQIYVPPLRSPEGFVATREYFPRNFKSALRQRTRWVMGIALQGWERHGWSGGWKQMYWLWRDRRGLIGSPLSLLTNLLTIYGLTTHVWTRVHPGNITAGLCWVTFGLQLVRMASRTSCVASVYGWRFAALTPLRTVYANALNSAATSWAIYRYTRSRIRGEQLGWMKTSHSYPTREGLAAHRRKVGDILVEAGYLTADYLSLAVASQPKDKRLGEYLIDLGVVTEKQLFEALSVQQGLPLGAPPKVSTTMARTLPAHVVRDWHVLPFRVESGKMFVAAAELPTDALNSTLRKYTSLEVRFHLVTPSEFRELTDQIER
jgi:bacteriophage N4 adsorption protein B